jgi:hypothetical protein
MIKKKPEKLTLNVSTEVKEQFYDLFNGSEMNSMGQFLEHLINYYTSPENIKIVEKEVEVEKIIEKQVPVNIDENQVIVDLNPIHKHLFEIIFAEPEKMESFNSKIEKLKSGKSVWWDNALKSKFKDIYTPFLTENLDNPIVIKHNISASLINSYMYLHISQVGYMNVDCSKNIESELSNFIESLSQEMEVENA